MKQLLFLRGIFSGVRILNVLPQKFLNVLIVMALLKKRCSSPVRKGVSAQS